MIAKKKVLIYSIFPTVILLLILFCIFILVKNNNFSEEYSLDLGLPDKNFYEDNYGCSMEKILSYRNFKLYHLSNEEQQNETTFEQIQHDVHKIIKKNDGKNGVHVKFDKRTKYGDVVRLLDICEVEKSPFYILKDYDIWIMAGSNEELKKDCPLKFWKP